MSVPRRILIVNPFGIGDVLFSTPLVRAVRRAFPEGRIGYLCNRRTEYLLWRNPHVADVFVYEKDELVRLWRASFWKGWQALWGLLGQIRRARFDLAIDLSLGKRYGFILRLLGVRRRVGFNFRGRGRFLTEALTTDGYHEAHVVEYYRALLSRIGVRLLDHSLELPCLSDERRWADEWLKSHGLSNRVPLVGLVPAGGVSWGIEAPYRRWDAAGFAAVADALEERYHARVLLFGESADRPVCQTVAQRMQGSAVDVSGQTSLAQFVSLLGRLDLVVCNDGGPLHLAVSQGVKTVSVFGPVDPIVYGPHPSDSDRHRVVRKEDLPCHPCYHRFKLPPCPYERACLLGVTAEQVIEACAALLGPARIGAAA